jgi:hypothetical protein
VVVQRGERRVQVVERRVDQAQRHHRAAQHLLRLGVRGRLGAEAVPGQDHPAVRGRQVGEVALTLVDVSRLDVVPRAAGVERAVVPGLGGALRVAEAGAVHRAVHRERAVRRVHHVGQPGLRLQHVHGVAEVGQRVPELLPLLERQRAVDRHAGVHPRVDGVLDREVLRRTHEICPDTRHPLRVAHAVKAR